MAANTCTSTTGVVTGTDPDFVLTYKTNNDQGIVLYLKYTKGTEANVTITFYSLNPSLSASDKYRLTSLSGTLLSAYTLVLASTGNYRVPVPIIASEKQVAANITFSLADQGGAIVSNFMES
jgi:hypothetical protein